MKGDRELEAMNAAFGALVNLNEQERLRVLEWLIGRLEMGAVAGKMRPVPRSDGGGPQSASVGRVAAGTVSSPRDFIAEKRPTTEVERATCLAYYLTHYRDLPVFKTRDITRLNGEARQPKFSNPAVAVANATRQNQYLVPIGGGKKQITVRGESLVEALPERERVAEALAANPLVGRKRRAGRAGARGRGRRGK